MRNLRRRWLVDSIRKHLLPEFQRRGFETVPIPSYGPQDRELLLTLPFGRLLRKGERGIELVEIQLEAHGAAAFSFVIGVVPRDGIQTIRGWVAARDVLVTWLNEYHEMYQSRLFRTLFRVRAWPYRKVSETNYEQLVAQAIKCLDEIESTLRTGSPGEHMRTVRISRPQIAA